jgi:hypothetical protein
VPICPSVTITPNVVRLLLCLLPYARDTTARRRREGLILTVAMEIDWKVELLRLSVFSNRDHQVSDDDWTAVTGQAESQTRQSPPGGGRVYQGIHREAQLTIASYGQRVDVVQTVNPAVAPQDTGPDVTFGDWTQVREQFVHDTEHWLSSVGFPVVRLAFSCVLLAPAEDRLAAYQVLEKLLRSVIVDPVRMRELIFRINWPVKSAVVPDLALNRITTWASIFLQSVRVQLGGGTPSVYSGAKKRDFVRLELDHNTDEARTEPFEPTQLVPIYKELVELAIEDAAKGEQRP